MKSTIFKSALLETMGDVDSGGRRMHGEEGCGGDALVDWRRCSTAEGEGTGRDCSPEMLQVHRRAKGGSDAPLEGCSPHLWVWWRV